MNRPYLRFQTGLLLAWFGFLATLVVTGVYPV